MWTSLDGVRRAESKYFRRSSASSALRFGIRVLRAGLRACRGAGRRVRGVEEGEWASSVVVVRRPGAGGASSRAASGFELATGWPSRG